MAGEEKITSSQPFHLRKATVGDIPPVEALIDQSVRALHPPFYKPVVINLALEQLVAIDSHHVNDGAYFVVETILSQDSISQSTPAIIGCGGWSNRTSLHSSGFDTSLHPEFLDPLTDAAKIRALFVHSDWVEKGIASMLLKACEDAIQKAGFKAIEIRASLQAVLFYERKGYEIVEKIDKELGNGEVLELAKMRKTLV